MNLYLLQYNNYYNRLVKREEGISAYLPYVIYGPEENDEYLLTEIENFYEADGVSTQQVVNTPTADFDYLVAVDEYGRIDSRWFVIEAVKDAKDKYVLSLHRDLFADYYDDIISQPCYVERAIVNHGNKLIYNSENSQVNQIKMRETLLKDITGCPWIVGYVALDVPETQISSSTVSIDAPVNSSFTYDQFTSMAANGVNKINSITVQAEGYSNAATDYISIYSFKFGTNTSGEYSKRKKTDDDRSSLVFYTNKIGSKQGPAAATTIQQTYEGIAATVQTNTENYVNTETSELVLNNDEVSAALSQNGLRVSGVDSVSYIATLTQTGTTTKTFKPRAGALYENLIKIMQDAGVLANPATQLTNQEGFTVIVEMETYAATVKRYDGQAFTATIKTANKALKDAPYKMFCIPYPIDGNSGRTWIYKENAEGEPQITDYIPDKQASLNFAMAIAKTLGSNLYDMQLLPYCPAREWTTAVNPTWGQGPITILDQLGLSKTGAISNVNDEVITPVVEGGKLLTYALWCETSSMNFTINNPITVPNNSIDFKVEHETSFCRLVSPNYSGAFEFKPTSNQGVDYFEVNCTYKPFQPYIHVAPNFKGLYGGDYNDARGLICGGDFSLPTLGDAWEQYQINNKSYLESFNRQIENMEITYNIQRNQQREAAAINAISAGISGASTGALMGGSINPWGSLAGLATGGIAAGVSAYGAQRDLIYADQMFNESRAYAKDQFNLSLQNIQALPYTLNRVGAYDINNKFFPFLEFYSCSDEEKAAMTARIRYTSMTVGAIGTVEEYLQAEPSFIQAQLIRFEPEDTFEDYHIVAAIAAELHKGIYI